MNKKRIYELEEITTHSDGDYIVVDNASFVQKIFDIQIRIGE